MNCGFAIECYLSGAATGFFDWLASLLTFNTVLAIWAGAIFGAQFRWPGVVAITFGLAALIQRKQSADTHEHVSGADAAPVVKPKKKVRPIFGKR
jgi:hypothetical protein